MPVKRDGVQKISAEEIVPGDILIIEEGGTISADAILLKQTSWRRRRQF